MTRSGNSDWDKLAIAARLAGVKSYEWTLSHTYCTTNGREDRFRLYPYHGVPVCLCGCEFSASSFARWAVRLNDIRLAATAIEMMAVDGKYV